MSASCKWFAGKTKKGYEVKCLVPAKSMYAKPKGTPRGWKLAFGPFSSAGKALKAAQRQKGYGRHRSGKRRRR